MSKIIHQIIQRKMSTQTPQCLIIGAGGVGVVTAYSLFLNKGSTVSLVARSDYDKASTTGYKLSSCDYGEVLNWKPHHLFRSVEDAASSKTFFDYVVVTTKNIPDGPTPVSSIIKPIIESNDKVWKERADFKEQKKTTNVVLIQNGIDIENEIKEKFDLASRQKSTTVPQVALISGIQLISSTKVGPCEIAQKGHDHLTCAAFDKNDEISVKTAQNFISLYTNPGQNQAHFDSNCRYTRWKKLLYNSSINTLTAICGLDFTRCLQFGTAEGSTEFEIVRPAMLEIIDLAKKIDDITIEVDLVDFFVDITRKMVYTPSMGVDIQKGQLMEIEVIVGNVVRSAKAHHIEVPHLSMLYNILKILQGKLKEQRGLLKFDELNAKIVE